MSHNRRAGRPKEYGVRQRVSLDMTPADILTIDEYAILHGMPRGKALVLLALASIKAPPVQERLAQADDLSIPAPLSQLAPVEQVESPQIEPSRPSWLRKLSLGLRS